MFIVYALIKFVVHAVALKLAVGAVADQATDNSYKTALSVSAALVFAGWICGFVPLIGGLLSLVVWCGVMMSTYKLTLVRSVVVAITQAIVGFIIFTVLGWFGLIPATMSYWM